METCNYDYYYGVEGEQFAFFRIPKLLITDSRYKDLSLAAKMLYGLMLERMSLSRKNKWLDEQNRVYVIYSVEKVAEDLNCSTSKAVKAMAELDAVKGIGLIERKRRGQGNPDLIYVKNFTSIPHEMEETDSIEEPKIQETLGFEQNCKFENSEIENSKNKNSGIQNAENENSTNQNAESENSRIENAQKEISRDVKLRSLEFAESAPNNTDLRDIENNYTESIHQSYPAGESMDGIDEMDEATAYMELIKENIDYNIMMSDRHWTDREMYDELYELICDVVCVSRKTIRIAGEDYPYQLVKNKFLKLNSQYLQYVISCMKSNTTKVANIRAYLITALYNAPNTIGHYYKAEVNHDFYGVD